MRLTPGTFLGVRVKTRSIAGFTSTEYRYAAGTRLSRHSHERAYFSFVLRGSYEERYSSNYDRQCHSETTLYHPAGEDHSDTFGALGGLLFSIELAPHWTKTAQEYELNTEEPLAMAARQVSTLGWRAYRAFSDPHPRSDLILEATAIELLNELPWKRSRVPEARVPPWLRQAVEMLHVEFRDSFSLTSVARRVGTHPVHLARTFQRHHGMTMGEYVRRLRISFALEALVGSEASLSAIAAQAGFADQSHLGRIFKAATGMTPLQYRNKSAR
jgi:AraC family transcriptional regulator